MKKFIHKTACLFLLTGVVAVMTGCTCPTKNADMVIIFQEWKTENPEPPKWNPVNHPAIDKIGETVINGLAVAKWKRLNALSESSTGVEGEQDYWAVQRAIATKQDEATEEKGEDLTDEEVSEITTTILTEYTPEQLANFVKVQEARSEASGAYAEWGNEIGSQLPDLLLAGNALYEEFKGGFEPRHILLIGAVGNILGAIGDISAANEGIQWLQDREELIKQHEANLKSGSE